MTGQAEKQQAVVSSEKYSQFRALYDECRARGGEVFDFEGQEVLVDYARYLIWRWEGSDPNE